MLRFFLGDGWLTIWYVVFYVLGVLPMLLFLGYVRRTKFSSSTEGLVLTYGISSLLLTVLSAINGLLLASALPIRSFLKYPLAAAAVTIFLFGFWSLTSLLLKMRINRGRPTPPFIYALILLLLYVNLGVLWIAQKNGI
jgi:hypothetical protein